MGRDSHLISQQVPGRLSQSLTDSSEAEMRLFHSPTHHSVIISWRFALKGEIRNNCLDSYFQKMTCRFPLRTEKDIKS